MSKNKCIFKSVQPFYDKERWNYKPNTVRQLEPDDERLPLLKVGERITIQLAGTEEQFDREIIDVSTWNGLTIISWKPE